MNVEIANNLVILRKKSGLSQEALAEKIGVSRQAVSKWERAESSPDTENLIALSNLYNITLDDMLQGNFKEAENTDNETKKQKEGFGFFLKLFPYPVLIVIIYLFIGIVWNLWSPGWLLFLTIPIWAAMVKYFNKNKST